MYAQRIRQKLKLWWLLIKANRRLQIGLGVGLVLLLALLTALVYYIIRQGDISVAGNEPIVCNASAPGKITFETVNGQTPSEAGALTTQYSSTHFISFATFSSECQDLSLTRQPAFVKRGEPQRAFLYSIDPADGISSQFKGADAINPNFITQTGDWFITSTWEGLGDFVPCGLVINYTTPTLEFGIDIIDLDGGEGWQIKAYDINNVLVTSKIVEVAENDFYGNGKPVTVKLPTQPRPIWKITIEPYGVKENQQMQWGHAFDNITPFCGITTNIPKCGNGVVETGEQCDDGNSTNGDGCDNTCRTEVVFVPPTIDKTASIASTNETQSVIQYTLAVTNNHSQAINNVTVTDQLPSFVTASMIQNQSTSYTFNFNDTTHVATWSNIPTMAAGQTITISYLLTVQAANYGVIPNTASVLLNGQVQDTDDDQVTLEVSPVELPQTIEKTAVLGTVTGTSAQVQYTLVVSNPNDFAVDDLIVTDQMPNFVTTSQVQNNSSYAFSFNDTTHVGTWLVPTIAANGSVTITYTLTVLRANYGTVPNTATVYVDDNGDNVPNPEEQDDQDDASVVITPPALQPLSIVKTGAISSTNATNAVVDYTLTVTNPNAEAISNVLVTDQMQSFVTSGNVQNTSSYSFSFNDSTHIGTWVVPSIAANGTVTITYRVTIAAANYGTIPNTAFVYVDDNNDGTPQPNELDDQDDESVVITAPVELLPLTIQKTGSIATVNSSVATIGYTLVVTNPNATVMNDVIVTDQLPSFVSGGQIQNTSSYQFSFNASTHVASWVVPSVPANGSITITYTLTVNSANYGNIDNVAYVYVDDNHDDQPQPNELDDQDDESVPVNPSIQASITKVGTLNNSTNTITYSVTATNPSGTNIVGATVTDTLDSAVQASWVQNISNSGVLNIPTITWSNVNINVGGTFTATYNIVYPDGIIDGQTLTNTVVITDSNNNPLDQDTADVTIPVEELPQTAIISDSVDQALLVGFGLILLAGGFVLYKPEFRSKYLNYGDFDRKYIAPFFDSMKLPMPYEERVAEKLRRKAKKPE